MPKARISVLVALSVAASFSGALAAPYTFTTITVPSATPVTSTVVSGINDAGQIVGTYVPAGSTARGFIDDLATGTVTTFYDPTTLGTFGNGINDLGQVVGTMMNAFRGPSGYVRDPVTGAFTELWLRYDTPTGFSAYGINNAGQVVGNFPVPTSIPRDQIYLTDSLTSGALLFFSTFPTSYIDGYDVNNLGQVVGSATFPTSPTTATITGFIGVPTTNTYSLIRFPGAAATTAYGINDIGQVVGSYRTGSTTNAFLLDLSTGTYTTLTDPNGTSTTAYGIDNTGRIVGSFIDGSGVQAGFVATPTATAAVPEPATLALLASSLCALTLTRRRIAPPPG